MVTLCVRKGGVVKVWVEGERGVSVIFKVEGWDVGSTAIVGAFAVVDSVGLITGAVDTVVAAVSGIGEIVVFAGISAKVAKVVTAGSLVEVEAVNLAGEVEVDVVAMV